MKKTPIYLSLLLLLTCAKEDNTSLIEGYQLQISQLNSKITEYSNQVTQLQSTVNSLNSQVNTIPGLEDTITSLNEQIGELEDTITTLTSEVSVIPDLNDEITSLEETIASLNEQIEELEEAILLKDKITVNEQLSYFSQSEFDYYNMYHSLGSLRNSIHYVSDNVEYILFAGETNPAVTGKIHGNPFLFQKNENNQWVLIKTFNEISMGGIRQSYKLNDNTFIFADAAEGPLNGSGPAGNGIVRENNFVYIAKVNGENVSWTKLGNTEGYHHDVSFGYLNNDDFIDIYSNSNRGTIFYGNINGFDNEIINVASDGYGSAFFSNEITDIDNDGINEIIEVAYRESSNDMINGFRIYKRDNDGKYLLYKTNLSSGLPNRNDLGATWTESLDLNFDGNVDLIILREGENSGNEILEIYFGDGKGNFNSNQLIESEDIWLLTPFLLDIDLDGDKDLVFSSAGDNQGLRLGKVHEDGFRLENLIYLNNGNGEFQKYQFELIKEGYGLNQFIPFVNPEGLLSFYSIRVERAYNGNDCTISNESKCLTRVVFWEVTINNL